MAGAAELKAGFAPPAADAGAMTEAETMATAALTETLAAQLRSLTHQLDEIEALRSPPH